MEKNAKYRENFTFLGGFMVFLWLIRGHKRSQVASRGLGRAEGRLLWWLSVIERYQKQQECGARPDTEEISLFCQGNLQTKRRWGL